MLLNDIFFAFWFFLPAAVSGTAAVFASRLPFLKNFSQPIDFGLKFKGKRIFGDHKTIRGFVVGILVSILFSLIEQNLYLSSSFLQEHLKLDYSSLNAILLGFLGGLGCMTGDAVKSFFKRRLDIKPGKSWIPFDQIDYIIGGIILTAFYIPLQLNDYLLIFIVWTIIHPLSTITGYLLKVKDAPI